MSFDVPYANLASEALEIREALTAAFDRVMRSGRYILGPELSALEQEFAEYCGTRYAVGTSSGTAALVITLRSLGLEPGAEVITAPNSFVATAAAVALAGAKPVFADIGEDGNLDPASVERVLTPASRVILPVHLTGRPCRMSQLLSIAERHDLIVIEDAAQAVGARLHGRRVGGFGRATCFSLNPLKNLHAMGDGGMVATNDVDLYQRLLRARNHGLADRERCEFFSFNCRLDELQAALLRVQLPLLDGWTEARRKAAFRYNDLLAPHVEVPLEGDGEYCVFQTYVVRTDRRDALQARLRSSGVEALVHYGTAIDEQPAVAYLQVSPQDLPKTRRHVGRILSLPLYPGITAQQQALVAQVIGDFFVNA